MSEPYLGEVKIISFNFPPKGWAFCNGQLLPINQNQALFSILGTTYGGDGRQTFALPNLQGRIPLHVGAGFVEGQIGGAATVTLLSNQVGHTHPAHYANMANADSPAGNIWAPDPNGNITCATVGNEVMAPGAISPAGGNQPHSNIAPYLVVNFVIALQGIFPSRN